MPPYLPTAVTTMPLVSVIIPTCNGVNRYVNESIASVLAQTFQDFELIIIDDASTDGTLEYTQGLIPAHHKVIYHQRETNGGPAAARNDGAKRAKGEFLVFLDQDDILEPMFLEETVIILQSTPDIMAVHTDGYMINAHGEQREHVPAIKQHGTVSSYLEKGCHLAYGVLFRKSSIEAIQGYDEQLRIWEDRDFSVRFIHQWYPHLTHLPKPLYRHRLWGHSACGNTDPHKAFSSRAYFLEKHAPVCQNDPRMQHALQDEWARLYSDMGKHAACQRQKKQAREWYRQSLHIRPFSRQTWLRYLRSFVSFTISVDRQINTPDSTDKK